MNNDPNLVNAFPTKDLFIKMLIKDLPLAAAISDLVDNSIDGARRLRTNLDFSGLEIKIEANSDRFQISDNCGGIPVDLARNYAFRFGRPVDMPATSGSIGRFGIGMKRALFKLGRKFTVKSTSYDSRFVLSVDVEKWEAQEDNESDWNFTFESVEEGIDDIPIGDCGTVISVNSLHLDVSNRLRLSNYLSTLQSEIELDHMYSIANGLRIILNQNVLKGRVFRVYDSDEIRTGYWEKAFNDGLSVKAYAGVSSSNLEQGGWYLFGNGKRIIGPDQSDITGWGTREITKIPKYHGQFERFRGFVLFEADDASLLPWNTTKTSVDVDSPRFRSIRIEMIKLMRPVIDYLNALHRERQRRKETDELPLASALRESKLVVLAEAKTSPVFVAPKPKQKPRPAPEMGRIEYRKPLSEIGKVKKCLGVRKHEDVGKKTFEYFLEMECSD